MTDVRLTFHGLTEAGAMDLANRLIAEWVNRRHPKLDRHGVPAGTEVVIVHEDDLARERAEAELVRALRAVTAMAR